MALATLSKVGNSMAVLLPKALREQALLAPDIPLRVESPRQGVVVITAIIDNESDRIDALSAAEARIAARKSTVESWPKDFTAEDILRQGQEGRAHELVSL